VERLLRFPRLGRVVAEARDENIRELVYQNYRIIYRIAGESIEILTVVHGKRVRTKRRTPPWEIG
jgi:plasmid stabilization system protein ParE